MLSHFFIIVLICLNTCSGLNDDGARIEIVWDITSYVIDGYTATVSIKNNEANHSIHEPGWELGWTWYEDDLIIWYIFGAKATIQGDCSAFLEPYVPKCCLNSPTIVDLPLDTRDNLRVENCCKGGVITPKSFVSFQLTVGRVVAEAVPPQALTFVAPGSQYICDSFTEVATSSGSQLTWKTTCAYLEVHNKSNEM